MKKLTKKPHNVVMPIGMTYAQEINTVRETGGRTWIRGRHIKKVYHKMMGINPLPVRGRIEKILAQEIGEELDYVLSAGI